MNAEVLLLPRSLKSDRRPKKASAPAISPTSRATWLKPTARAFFAGGIGTLRQSGQSSCGDMTGISQYGPAPCRCGPRGARSRETGLRANAASPPQATREDHVSARFIRYLAAVALGVLPTQARAQRPPAPQLLRV